VKYISPIEIYCQLIEVCGDGVMSCNILEIVCKYRAQARKTKTKQKK
jgi:hypothetical protein